MNWLCALIIKKKKPFYVLPLWRKLCFKKIPGSCQNMFQTLRDQKSYISFH